jgi:hypothetical protein
MVKKLENNKKSVCYCCLNNVVLQICTVHSTSAFIWILKNLKELTFTVFVKNAEQDRSGLGF